MKKLENIRILVIGDIMIDKYVIGNINKISQEAPVPIVEVLGEYSNLGGAGNVVKNIRNLGARVDCLASIANDFYGDLILQKINKLGVGNYLIYESEITTVKERVVANSRKIQMLRIDREIIKEINADIIIKKLKEYFKKNTPDIIIVSDYTKGLISEKAMAFLKEQLCKIIVDPKPKNALYYKDVFMITPNEKEFLEIQSNSPDVLEYLKYLLITKGKDGMYIEDHIQSWDIPAEEIHKIYNLSGAGDTVIAIMGVCLALKINPITSAKIANVCAAYVVTQPDTSCVPKKLFLETMQKKLESV